MDWAFLTEMDTLEIVGLVLITAIVAAVLLATYWGAFDGALDPEDHDRVDMTTVRSCRYPSTSHPAEHVCLCHARLGNDFWSLPSGNCLYRRTEND